MEQAQVSSFNLQELAQAAYVAYSALTDNKNFRGEEMPAFEDLPIKIKTAWEVSVRHTIDCLREDSVDLDTSHWRNWESPFFKE